MTQKLKAVVAAVLVAVVLLPNTALPLMYAPDSPRKEILEGHPDPPIKVATSRSQTEPTSIVLWTLPFGLIRNVVMGWSSDGFFFNWK
jgi:hypothetical protein